MKKVKAYISTQYGGGFGFGAWSVALIYGNKRKEFTGSEKPTMDFRLEILGVINALEKLKEPCIVDIFTDGTYVADRLKKNSVTGYRGVEWDETRTTPPTTPALWGRLFKSLDKHDVMFHHMTGYDSNYSKKQNAPELDVVVTPSKTEFCTQY